MRRLAPLLAAIPLATSTLADVTLQTPSFSINLGSDRGWNVKTASWNSYAYMNYTGSGNGTVLQLSPGPYWAGSTHGNETVLSTLVNVDGVMQAFTDGTTYSGNVVQFTRITNLTDNSVNHVPAYRLESTLTITGSQVDEDVRLVGLNDAQRVSLTYAFLGARNNNMTDYAIFTSTGGLVGSGVTNLNDDGNYYFNAPITAVGQYDPVSQNAALSAITLGADLGLSHRLWDRSTDNKLYAEFSAGDGYASTTKDLRMHQRVLLFNATPSTWMTTASNLLGGAPPVGDTLYWDTSDTTGIQGGNGMWSHSNWNAESDGSGTRQSWIDGKNAVISAGGSIGFGSTINANSITVDAPATLNSGAGQLYVAGDVTTNANTDVQWFYGKTGYGLNKAGPATMTVRYLKLSSATGPTNIKAGTLKINSSATKDDIGFGTNLTIADGAVLDINNVTGLTGFGMTGPLAAPGYGIVTNTGASVVNFTNSQGSVSQNSMRISFTGNLNLIKSGTRTMRMPVASTYVGSTTLGQGSILTDVTNALPTHTTLYMGQAANNVIYDINSFAQEIGALQDGPGATGSLTVTNTGSLTNSLTINGQIYSGGALVNSDSSYSGRITGKIALVKQTAATRLTLSGDNTYIGGTTVNAGTLLVGHVNALGTGSLSVGAAGKVEFSPSITTAVKITGLSIAPGGTIDLANHSLVIDYSGAAGTLEDDLRQHLQNGGLTSSSAGTPSGTKLGYGDNAVLGKSDLAGQTVDSDSMLIKFTYAGDANLDGQVTISDLGDLASNWQSTTAVWRHGDFNYDGAVTISDLGDLASNWQAGVGSPLGTSFEQALAAVGLGGISVPEPAGFVAFSFAAWSLRRRRGRA